jgi:hypothetical protein
MSKRLPVIVRDFEPEERAKMVTKVKTMKGKKIVVKKGLSSRRTTIPKSHVLLCAGDKLPSCLRNEAYAICGKVGCLEQDHLIWEYRSNIAKRRNCAYFNCCVCDLQPACLTDLQDHE